MSLTSSYTNGICSDSGRYFRKLLKKAAADNVELALIRADILGVKPKIFRGRDLVKCGVKIAPNQAQLQALCDKFNK